MSDVFDFFGIPVCRKHHDKSFFRLEASYGSRAGTGSESPVTRMPLSNLSSRASQIMEVAILTTYDLVDANGTGLQISVRTTAVAERASS